MKSETEIEALGQQARDLALSVETVRKEIRLKSEIEIEALVQQARDLAVLVETARTETHLKSESEIAALGQQARDLAMSVESVREETLVRSDSKIAALGQQARDLAVSVESVRKETLLQANTKIKLSSEINEELEHRVLERTGQLQAANKELEAFSYSVSHDLRAPLRAIDGFSRILLEDYTSALPDEAKLYLQLVRDNTKRMGQLVDDLLAFSRLSRLPLTRKSVDTGRMARLCLTELQAEQEGRQLEIVIDDLPNCQADPTLIKQVWTNLISNALKYTRKREAARISIGGRTEPRSSGIGTETVYSVTDNGAGFDMKYADKLFGVFQRLHRAVDFDGTGVGLAIVQRIVNRHGGRIWADAKVNQSATFSFTLE